MVESNKGIPFHIKLADMVIRIEPIFDYIKEYCKEYITDEPEDFTVTIKAADISFERECSIKEAAKEGSSVIEFSDAYLETLAVYRQIAEKLPKFHVLLFHGSVIAVDMAGYLFTAASGTGKSTHTRLWREFFGGRAIMVNDDKPLLRVTENGIISYGTPWNGKHRLSTNISVPLKAICVLTRDKVNHIEEIQPGEAYQMLLQQTYRPSDKASMVQTLELIDEMMKHTRFYKLGCNMNLEAAKVAFDGMNVKLREDFKTVIEQRSYDDKNNL